MSSESIDFQGDIENRIFKSKEKAPSIATIIAKSGLSAACAVLFTISAPVHAQDIKFDLAAMKSSSLPVTDGPPAWADDQVAPTAEQTVAMLALHASDDGTAKVLDAPQAPAGGVTSVSDGEQAAKPNHTRRDLARLEVLFQLLNVADAATTISCVESGTCREQNPLYGGPRPSWARVAGIKAGVGILHYMVYRTLAKSDTRLAKIFELTTVTIQGATVIWNMIIALK